MSTQIKRLYQSNTEFVPITLAEAVVVNTTNIEALKTYGITTLDKVLSATLGLVENNASNISILNNTVTTINNTLENKQDKLKPGAGIDIDDEGNISVTNSIELYKIVSTLPDASKDCANSIYLVATEGGAAGNIFTEYLCVLDQGQYIWEEIGKLQTNVDLSGYVTKTTFESTINDINYQLAATITAQNVTTSTNQNVVVSYDIPANLYDSAVGG